MTDEEAWELSKLAWWDEARRKKSFKEKIWIKGIVAYTRVWFWILTRKRSRTRKREVKTD